MALGGLLLFIAIGLFYLQAMTYRLSLCYKEWAHLPRDFLEIEAGCYIQGLMMAIALVAIPSGFGAWFLLRGLKEKLLQKQPSAG